jgi:molybdopterin synthase sulfur carrier subunit
MSTPPDDPTPDETTAPVTVHYWAAARAAAGAEADTFEVAGPVTLAEVVAMVLRRRPSPQLERVLDMCAVLVGERPTGAREPADVRVEPGETVEFLPPFAGG